MTLDDLELGEIFPPWFWWLGIGLAIGSATLLVLWYLNHPERSPFRDFSNGLIDTPASNGNTPYPAPGESVESVESN